MQHFSKNINTYFYFNTDIDKKKNILSFYSKMFNYWLWRIFLSPMESDIISYSIF